MANVARDISAFGNWDVPIRVRESFGETLRCSIASQTSLIDSYYSLKNGMQHYEVSLWFYSGRMKRDESDNFVIEVHSLSHDTDHSKTEVEKD